MENEVDLGSFKNAKTLKDAYDSLRSEFTRKSMELADLKRKKAVDNPEKQKEEITHLNTDLQTNEDKLIDTNAENEAEKNVRSDKENTDNAEVPDNTPSTAGNDENKSSETKEIENTDNKQNITKEFSDKASIAPEKYYWEDDNWSEKVKNFFIENPKAQNYAKDIAQFLMQDKTVKDNPLQYAWTRILEREAVIDLENEAVLDKIYSNETIRKKIIEDYLNALKRNKVAPSLISKSGGVSISATKKGVTTLEEAKKITKKIFE